MLSATTNSLKFITTTGTTIDLAAGTYSANFDGAGTLKLLGTVVNDEVIGNATTIGTLDMNSNTLDNGAALIKVGTLTLSGSILGGASLQVTGTAAIGANVTTTGDQLFQGAAIVSVDTILTNTNSDVTFSSTLNSDATPRDLTIDTGGNTGTILFSGAVGQTNDFDVITITGNLDLDADIGADDFSAAGATSIAVSGASNLGGDVTTSGTQTYTGAVTLSGAARTLKGSTVTFGSTLAGGGQNLTITGDAVFGGNATGLGALDVSGTLAANATNITATNESITIQGTTTIADGITLVVDSGTADKDITFAAITAGDAEGQNLTIDAGTNANAQIFLNGDVTNLDTLSITDAGILNLVGNITVDTLVIPTAVNNVIVSGNITTTADTSFANVGTTIIGNADDDVNTFGGGLDITAGPTSATAITLQGTIKTTNDQIDIGDADTGIRIAGTATITTNGAGVINLAGAISGAGGAQNLIINSTGATTISQAVTALQNLTTDALGSTILEGNVTTSALQTYGDTVTISGTRTLQGTTVSMASVQGNGDDDDELTITGIFDLNGAATADLKTLSVSSSSNIGGDVTTSTTQTYTGAVVMSGGDRTLTATQVNFGNTVDGGGAELAIVGILNLDGALTNTTNLSVSSTSTLDANVTTTGTQTYTGGVTLGTGARTLQGSTVTFGSTLAGGGQNLTITGDAVFGGNATGLGALDVSGTLAANATNITATNESITIQGTTTIADGITLVVDSGTADKDITFAAITAGDAEGQNLTINAGTNANAQIFLNGDVTNLDTLSITDAGILNLVGNITVDTLVIPTAVNNVIVSGNITTTADTSFANVGTTIIGNADDDVNTFGGGLDITAGPTSATAITLQGTIKTTNDQIDIGDADTGIRIAGTATITTNGAGVINLAGAISGAGGAQNLIINSTGATTISQAVTALQNLTTDALGSTILQGNVTTSALQTYGDTVTISGDQNFTRYNSFNGFCSR